MLLALTDTIIVNDFTVCCNFVPMASKFACFTIGALEGSIPKFPA